MGGEVMDECPFCGAYSMVIYGMHPQYQCGTLRCLDDVPDIEKRSPKCYETQIAALKTTLRQAEEVVRMVNNTLIDMESIHPDGLPAKYLAAYEGILLVGPKAVTLLPEIERLVGEGT
jgi:hypothetical protein